MRTSCMSSCSGDLQQQVLVGCICGSLTMPSKWPAKAPGSFSPHATTAWLCFPSSPTPPLLVHLQCTTVRACDGRFVVATTLAVHVYCSRQYKQLAIITGFERTIHAVAASPHPEPLLACAMSDQVQGRVQGLEPLVCYLRSGQVL